MMLMNS